MTIALPALALALPIGASLVLLGAGGSIVTVPVLIYAAGLSVQEAAGTSLLVVGLVAGVGAALNRDAVHVRYGLVLGVAGMTGALFGTWLNHQVRDWIVLTAFAATTIAAATRMGSKPVRGEASETPRWARALLCGTVLGVATGFFGVGGGFLIVPALVVCMGLRFESAVATSLLVIALNSAAGLLAHGSYGTVRWDLGGAFAVVALVGALGAWPLGEKVGGQWLQRAFAGLLVAIGVGMGVHTLAAVAQ